MTTPSGSISLAQQHLKLQLADCAAFRTWCKTGNQAEALSHIYLEGLPKPPAGQKTYMKEQLESLRPYALVNTKASGGFSLSFGSFGSHAEYDASGKLEVTLFQNCPENLGNDPTSDANQQFSNFCGELIDQLATLSGQAGYLCFERLTFDGPYWTHPLLLPTEDLYQWCEIGVDWKGS
jgi:hypothetical protein